MKHHRISRLFLFISVLFVLLGGSAVCTQAATIDTSTVSGKISDPYPVIVSGPAAPIIREAARYLGYPYVWGGNSLTNGCDCSHYCNLIYAKCGYPYTYRTSYSLRTFGTAVKSLAQAQAGDLICYNGHVAIYDGCGRIYEAMGAKWGIVHKRTADHGPILAIRRIISGRTTAKPTTAARVLRTEVTAYPVNMRTSKSMSSRSNIICKVPTGSSVSILSDESGWHKIKYNGNTGYMKTGYFKSQQKAKPKTTTNKTTATTKTTAVTRYASANVNFRRSPSTSGSVIMQIPKGAAVSVTKNSNGWSYVTYKSRTGWVMSSYLKSTYSEAVKTVKAVTRYASANVNFRKSPSTSGSIIMKIPRGASVSVTKTSNGWSNVTYKSRTGWVMSSYLKSSYSEATKKTTATKSTSSSKTYLRYTTANVYLRKTGAIKSGNIITLLPKNAAVNVIRNSNGWSYLSYKSKYGWVKSSYLNKKRT